MDQNKDSEKKSESEDIKQQEEKSESEDNQEENKSENVKENAYVTRINIIFANINQAQILKDRGGGLSMEDCKHLVDAVKLLTDFFNENASDQSVKTSKKHMDAFGILTSCCVTQQTKGAFSIEGSVFLLDLLQLIEKALNDNKEPGLKMEEIKRKYKNKRKG